MISKRVGTGLLILLFAVTATGVAVVHLDNGRLRRQIAVERRSVPAGGRIRTENSRMQALLASLTANRERAVNAVREEVEQSRREMAETEARARRSYSLMAARRRTDTAMLAGNRDPERGLARLENLREMGQSTPAAAFQTLAWAALKGADERLAKMVAIDAAAREKAAAMMAALSAADRTRYPSAEKVAALFFADALTAWTAAEIVGVENTDGAHATVAVRGLGEKVQKFPFELGPDGWRIVVTPALVEKLGGWVNRPTPRGGP